MKTVANEATPNIKNVFSSERTLPIGVKKPNQNISMGQPSVKSNTSINQSRVRCSNSFRRKSSRIYAYQTDDALTFESPDLSLVTVAFSYCVTEAEPITVTLNDKTIKITRKQVDHQFSTPSPLKPLIRLMLPQGYKLQKIWIPNENTRRVDIRMQGPAGLATQINPETLLESSRVKINLIQGVKPATLAWGSTSSILGNSQVKQQNSSYRKASTNLIADLSISKVGQQSQKANVNDAMNNLLATRIHYRRRRPSIQCFMADMVTRNASNLINTQQPNHTIKANFYQTAITNAFDFA